MTKITLEFTEIQTSFGLERFWYAIITHGGRYIAIDGKVSNDDPLSLEGREVVKEIIDKIPTQSQER